MPKFPYHWYAIQNLLRITLNRKNFCTFEVFPYLQQTRGLFSIHRRHLYYRDVFFFLTGAQSSIYRLLPTGVEVLPPDVDGRLTVGRETDVDGRLTVDGRETDVDGRLTVDGRLFNVGAL